MMREKAKSLLKLVRQLPGLLVIIPFMVFAFGSYWLIPVPVHPERILLFSGSYDLSDAREVTLPRCPEGAVAGDKLAVQPRDALILQYDQPLDEFTMKVQIRGQDRCMVAGSTDGRHFTDISRASRQRAAGDRWSTRTEDITLAEPIKILRLTPGKRDEPFMVSRVDVKRKVLLAHEWIAWSCWGIGLLLFVLQQIGATRCRAERAIAGLSRIDLPLAVALVISILFQFTSHFVIFVVILMLIILVIQAVRWALRRVPLPALLFNLLFIFLFFRFVPTLLERYIIYRTATEYHLDVDHRMKPNGKEINMDGIRFKGESTDVRDSDFNILFLGDSFTYGMKLPYDDAIPYAFEEIMAGRACATPVRSINFGWVSSSPLLSYRLLLDIGHLYKPDLVVFLLDVTDFHDDIKYAYKISEREGFKLSDDLLLDNLLDRFLLRFMTLSSQLYLKQQFRPPAIEHRRKKQTLDALPVRYFATNLPLKETVPYFERGVMYHLGLIEDYCRRRLKVPMAVVLVPRAFQYSEKEVPRDYEAHLYTINGPNVRNPNQYFAEQQEDLPYPVLDLLPTFEKSGAFPLYFEDDPHWNADGAYLAAETLADFLVRQHLLPCHD